MSRWTSRALDVLSGAFALTLIEITLVFLRANHAFIINDERWSFALTTLCVAIFGVGVLTYAGLFVVSKVKNINHRALLFSIETSAIALVLSWSMTSGRRISATPWRYVLIMGAVSLVFILTRWLTIKLPARSKFLAGVALLAMMIIQVADMQILPRLYPAFHWGATLASFVCAALFGHLLSLRSSDGNLGRLTSGRSKIAFAVMMVFLIMAPMKVINTARAPNLSFVVESYSPLLSDIILAVGTSQSTHSISAPRVNVGPITQSLQGINLRNRDVLLITVDALRADRIKVYGGSNQTPAINMIAEQSAIFTKAYTPTPHTSYALASLFAAKYLRPILTLSNSSQEHILLPEILRQYGYRTAAFYPPAIFYVDTERFASLHEKGFGFEYRKEMFASAEARVSQVETYLKETPREHPVFVWVHLFEPHEPYEPSGNLTQSDSPEALYDGEVRMADRAIGQLIQMFRSQRQDATVIMTADHGEEFHDHGGQFHGSTLYDEQIHVPLLWSSPHAVQPHRIDAPVELIDISTTLLSALGIPREARMRGDDLSALLAQDTNHPSQVQAPSYAFADIADARMVTDGRWKAICRANRNDCLLFDLQQDPLEQHNVASVHQDVHRRLQSTMYSYVASIPQAEALAIEGEAGFPPVIARAELGDHTAAEQVVLLLNDKRPIVRAAAIRALVKIEFESAAPQLRQLADNDSDMNVRNESSIAVLVLGGQEFSNFADRVAQILENSSGQFDLQKRAAFALAKIGDARAAPCLIQLLENDSESEDITLSAILALGNLRAAESVDVLIHKLDDVRVRAAAANALGQIGERRAVAALIERLSEERYPPAREAEVRALLKLHEMSVLRLIRRYLGMQSGLPNGVGVLIENNLFSRMRAEGRDLRNAVSLTGFQCDAQGCRPSGSSLPMRVPHGSVRLILRVESDPGVRLRVGDMTFGPLQGGIHEVSLLCTQNQCSNPIIDASGELRIVGYVLVPSENEIPPPPPLPWDAGVSADSIR